MRKTRSHRTAHVEALESRRMLAGNVTAGLLDGSFVLSIVGDNKPNQITVQATLDSTVVIPLGDTTVNGGKDPVTFFDFPDLQIRTGNGDDAVNLTDMWQAVSVDTGNGNDTVTGNVEVFPPNLFVALTINTGNGDDLIDMHGDVDGQIFTSTEVLDYLTINTGNGNDVVRFRQGAMFYDNAYIDLGRGDDTLVFADYLDVWSDLNIALGQGDDTLVLGSPGPVGTVSFVYGNLIIDGGSGHDTLDSSAGTFIFWVWGVADVRGFETVI